MNGNKEIKNGRPRKLDKKLFDNLVAIVGMGNWYSVASAACGISKSAFSSWMKKGRRLDAQYGANRDKIDKEEVIFYDFYLAIRKVESKVEIDLVGKVIGDKDWKAQMTYLERKYPDRWGRTDRHKVDANINLNVSELTDAQLIALANGDDIEID